MHRCRTNRFDGCRTHRALSPTSIDAKKAFVDVGLVIIDAESVEDTDPMDRTGQGTCFALIGSFTCIKCRRYIGPTRRSAHEENNYTKPRRLESSQESVSEGGGSSNHCGSSGDGVEDVMSHN